MTCSGSEPATCGRGPSGSGPSGSGEPIAREQRRVADASGVLAAAGAIASQTALLGGLFYYFGRVHANATLAYFGLDISLVGYNSPDYLLRSINFAFLPFVKATFAALLLLGVHRFVVQRALEMPDSERAERAGQWLVTVMTTVAAAQAALVIIGMLVPGTIGRPLGRILPLLLIGSVALLGYARHLRVKYSTALATTRPSLPRAHALVLFTLGLLGIVWVVALHAEQVGKSTAADIAASPPARPAVVLYCAERIAVSGTGVEVAEIAQPGSKYRYQYSGIRLLARSADKYMLIPVDWQRGLDRIFIIPDDGSVRIDIAAR